MNLVLGYLVGKGDDLPNEVVRSLEILANRAYKQAKCWLVREVRPRTMAERLRISSDHGGHTHHTFTLAP